MFCMCSSMLYIGCNFPVEYWCIQNCRIMQHLESCCIYILSQLKTFQHFIYWSYPAYATLNIENTRCDYCSMLDLSDIYIVNIETWCIAQHQIRDICAVKDNTLLHMRPNVPIDSVAVLPLWRSTWCVEIPPTTWADFSSSLWTSTDKVSVCQYHPKIL